MTAVNKVRLYDLAKELKIDTKRLIEEVRRTWQFYRDRRPETYGPLTAL